LRDALRDALTPASQLDLEPADGLENDMTDVSWDDDLEEPEDGLHIEVVHEEVGDRKLLQDIRVGDMLTGTVIAQSLYHGAIVDVDAQVDG